MVRAAALTLTLLAIAGCATPAPPVYRWAKTGSTYDEFLKDRYACIGEARSQVSGGVAYGRMARVGSGEIIRADILTSCLSARGYRLDPNGFGPPDGAGVLAQ